MADLDAVEDRIWALLDRYRGELEEATIYGMPSVPCRRKLHDVLMQTPLRRTAIVTVVDRRITYSTTEIGWGGTHDHHDP